MSLTANIIKARDRETTSGSESVKLVNQANNPKLFFKIPRTDFIHSPLSVSFLRADINTEQT